jgi:tetratricopeptide (TPR) repeat protein
MNHHSHLKSLEAHYRSEAEPFCKVHRMVDLFESIVKTYAVVIISEYIRRNQISETAKGLLAQGLTAPSLGTWHLMGRVLFEELQKVNNPWMGNDFPEAFTYLNAIIQNEDSHIIAFRNFYASGATPDDARCEADIHKHEPLLNQLLQSDWIRGTSTEVKDGKVFLVTENGELLLHPFLLCREENGQASFAFFSNIKHGEIGLVDCASGKYYVEKEFYNEFHEYLRLDEWEKTGNVAYYQRIEELRDTFKGRKAERSQLLQFVGESSKGYCCIVGQPGIGKSALLAQFLKDLRADAKQNNVQVVEYSIRRGTIKAQVDYALSYLIKRTDEVFPKGRNIRAEGSMNFDLQRQLFSKWRLWAEQSQGEKLLFVIDGLDEGAENNMVSYMPREIYENILIIYGSRPGGHKSIEELWTDLPADHTSRLELTGLHKEDIRALLYEVGVKYELVSESSWIDLIHKHSKGNPLYLKFLCDSIENGNIKVNDNEILPEGINEYYKAIVLRYASHPDGVALLDAIYTFAAASDHLTMRHLELINGIGEQTLNRIESVLKELLYETTLDGNIFGYQLFHESFREYLIREEAEKISESGEHILNFCAGWRALEGKWEQRYALEHYARHLSESKREKHIKELLDLFQNTMYTSTQKRVLRKFNATNELYRLSLHKSGELKLFDVQMEAALCLVDLKYQEMAGAPQILALVVGNEIDLALERIESFGGPDKEGIRGKFILYMICLMELTILHSKNQPFRKEAIERLLNHLEEHLPTDHSILDWNDFFPGYIMFLMACEWAELGLDYRVVYKRTSDWDKDWLREQGPYSDLQFEVLKACASSELDFISTQLARQGKFEEAIEFARTFGESRMELFDETFSYNPNKRDAFQGISIEMAKQGEYEKAVDCVWQISDDYLKRNALIDISTELAKQGYFEKALSCTGYISDDYWKSNALIGISAELTKRGETKKAESLLGETLVIAREISIDAEKFKVFKEISIEFSKQGALEKALSCIGEISDAYWKSNALIGVLAELTKRGETEEAESELEEILACALDIKFYSLKDKDSAFKNISSEMVRLGNYEEALKCTLSIQDKEIKYRAFLDIATGLAKQDQYEKADSALNEALSCAREIFIDEVKCEALAAISTQLAIQGQLEKADSALNEALACAREIFIDEVKCEALAAISTQLAIQGQLKKADLVVNEALSFARGIEFYCEDNHGIDVYVDIPAVFRNISLELVKQGKFEDALDCAREMFFIEDMVIELIKLGELEVALAGAREIKKDDYSYSIAEIPFELAKLGEFEEAISFTLEINDIYIKIRAFKNISTELAKQGKLQTAVSMMFEIFFYHRSIVDNGLINSILTEISIELVKQGAFEKALYCAGKMSDHYIKSNVLLGVASELAKQGKTKEAESMLEKTIISAREIGIDSEKFKVFKEISTEFANLGKTEEATFLLKDALRYFSSVEERAQISTIFSKLGFKEEAASVIKEALECIPDLYYYNEQNAALNEISVELVKQGKLEEAFKCARSIYNKDNEHSIKDMYDTCDTFISISIELVNQGKNEEALSAIEEALIIAREINKEPDKDDPWEISVNSWKSTALATISSELAKQGEIEKALDCVEEISDDYLKSNVLTTISSELANQEKNEEALSVLRKTLIIAHKIKNEYKKYNSLKEISITLVKQGDWQFAEKVGLEIIQIVARHECWKAIAKITYAEMGGHSALQQVLQFQHEESRTFYLKGWVEAAEHKDVDAFCIHQALPLLSSDSESIEIILQKYALHEVFFTDSGKEKLERLNQSLNIQWALDIIEKKPDTDNDEYIDDNHDDWQNEVDDECDFDEYPF